MTSIAIIGGGQGGTSILKAFSGIDKFRILGICDVNRNAPGLQLAREMSVPVYSDIDTILREPGLDVVIEATGSDKVINAIYEKKQDKTIVIDSHVANVLMTLTESHEEIVKKANSKKEAFKTSAPFLIKTHEGGVVYFTTDLERYDFVMAKDLEIPGVKVGERLLEDGFIKKCIRTKREVVGLVDARNYGIALRIWVIPFFDDDDPEMVTGTYGVFIPKVHPVAKAFSVFAPIVIQSQPEGAQVMMTDLEKVTHRLGSDKFDLKDIQVGTPVREGDAGWRVIRQKSTVIHEVNSRKYGAFRIIGIPLFDEETGNVIGTFGIATPRMLAHNLQDMASKLNSNAQEIASVMEEIAASASEININEGHLANSIKDVQDISGQINEILNFIRSVADQTKMLGLNAAIEAARAGEHGRGFGVVAEEIRKLSDQSKGTAEQIRKLTREIDDKVAIAGEASLGSVKQSQEQAAATQEATASVMEMASLAEKLMELAKSI